jgi:ATP-binding cassette subfamily C protein CydD/ATP-binding cassette subfamily C protein CydCD
MNIKAFPVPKQALIAPCLLQLLISFCILGTAWQLSQVVCDVFINQDYHHTAVSLGLLFFFLLVKALLTFFLNKALNNSSQQVQSTLRQRLHQGAGHQSIPGHRLQILALDSVGTIDKLFTLIAPPLLSISLSLPIILMTVLYLDPWSALIMMVTLPIVPLLLWLIGQMTRRATLEQWKQLEELTFAFKDTLAGMVSLKIFRQENQQKSHLAALGHLFSRASLKVLRLAFISSFALELITTLTIAILAVAIGFRLLYGEMDFQRAFCLLLLLPEFYQPLRQSGMMFHGIIDVRTAWAQLQQVVDQHGQAGTEQHDTLRLPPKILLSNISFTYPGAPLPTLDKLSLAFPAGSITCLYGTSGMGKSTLLKLVAGLLTPQTGRICLEDKDLANIALDSRHRLITYIPQSPHVFQGSLADNICLFATTAYTEEMRRKITHIINAVGLHLSPNTPLGAGGQGLSHGERQRLGLARALYQNRPVVLLDEPTAGLEPREEQELLQLLSRFAKGKTIIVISHHRALRQWADTAIEVHHE